MDTEKCDKTIVVEGTTIRVHKKVLAARSKYFNSLFQKEFIENNKKEIALKGPPDEFKAVLQFMYTGKISLSSMQLSNIVKTYELVDYYLLWELKEPISNYLAAILALDNCFKILNAAYSSNVNDLIELCLPFIDCRASELIKHNTFKSLPTALLCFLLERDTFYARESDGRIYMSSKK